MPLDRYLREHAFGPLGMEHSDLVRSGRVQARLATGYQLRSRGLRATMDRWRARRRRFSACCWSLVPPRPCGRERIMS
jgi:CubicO group peptidase (beta-lactamase class C family)